MLTNLIKDTRSIRRFHQQKKISRTDLLQMIDAARLGGSARNLQPLKYLIIDETKGCRRIFPHLGWAGYLDNWPGPEEGERPAAYIICLLDKRLSENADIDLGIASQNLLLTATSLGYGGCRIASFSSKLPSILSLKGIFKILLIIALGVPKEKVRIDPLPANGSIRYWRDESMIHHVPKRSLKEVVLPGKQTED
jgi:nitroreductase